MSIIKRRRGAVTKAQKRMAQANAWANSVLLGVFTRSASAPTRPSRRLPLGWGHTT